MRNVKTKVYFSWIQNFAIDVYIDNEDNIDCLKDYIKDVIANKKDIILNDILEGNECTRVGLNTSITHVLDEDDIEILNDEEVNDIILNLNTKDDQ